MDELTKRKNRFVGARRFEITTDLLPDDVASKMLHLRQSTSGSPKCSVTITPFVDGSIDFELGVRRKIRTSDYVTVSARGIIIIDKGLDITVVRGEMSLGLQYLAIYLLPAVFILLVLFVPDQGLLALMSETSTMVVQFLCFVSLFVFFIGYASVRVALDYRQLKTLISWTASSGN